MIQDVTNILWETGDSLSSGADPKLWVTDGDKKFLLKRGQKRFPLEPYSEYVASRFISKAGLPVQEVEVVKFRGNIWAKCSYLGDIKQFKDIGDSSIFSDTNKEFWVLPDLLSTIAKMKKLTVEQRLNFVGKFKLLFVVDSVLANGDRHAGNFGYFADGEMSPIYDNGAALFPDIFQVSRSFSSIKELFKSLVIDTPISTIQLKSIPKHVKKETYYQMVSTSSVLKNEVKMLRSMNVEESISYAVGGLPPEFARFYSYVLQLRYDVIIRGIAFDRAFAALRSLKFDYPESVGDLCTRLRI